MSAVPLALHDLSWGYHPGAPCGSRLDLVINAGEALSVVGPNGAGKSTLLRTIAGQQPPIQGRVALGSRDMLACGMLERARRVALLPQGAPPELELTVTELVALGRTPHLGIWGRLRRHDRDAVERALEDCDLRPLADRRLGQLSGGERQRALIAMAVAQQAPLLLLDEPTTHLDLKRRQELFALLRQLRERTGVAVLMALHDLVDAFRESARVLVLSEGRAEQLSGQDPGLRPKLARAFGVDEDAVVLR